MSGPLNHDVIIRAATALFRVCVRMYPRRLRVEYGSEMEGLFRRRMLRASTAGSAPLICALLSGLQDVLAGAVAERLPTRRNAWVSLGLERRNDAGHEAHGSRWLDALWLDARFSLRMLVKHRGLTMVAGFAMAVAIAVGTTAFETISGMLDSALPFPGGERFVQLQFVGANGGGEEEQLMHEFVALRGQLRTVEHLSAYRTAQHNLVAAETAPEPVEVAEITPSAFAITNTAPLLGRYLLPSDEADSASPVVVIAYQAWQLHFARDPNVVGRTVRLSGVPRSVVGVMPEGFAFPLRHEFWTPLRVNPLEYPPGTGPSLEIFGRLAPRATIEQAQAEFAGLGQPMAAARAGNSLPLRPVVVPYTQLSDPTMLWALHAARLLASALTVLVAINLAILVYARTVTRLGELAVRSALGASRRRILTQLFIEALALALVGAAAGLAISSYALDAIQTMNETGELLPYWISFTLSPRAIVVALGLAVLSALIIGVVPGLKATGVGLTANLHELHGRSGTRLGVTWTALIVAQVAVAVAVLPAAVFISARVIRGELVGTGFPAESIVTGKVGLGPDAPKVDRDRAAAQQRQLLTKLEAEPGVTGVAFSAGVPGSAPIKLIRFQDGVRVRARAEHVPDVGITNALLPSTTRVDVDLFKTYGVQMLAGRPFAAADLGTTNVIVNRSFVEMYLQDPDPLGLLFLYEKPNPAQIGWHQIVGVVSNFPGFPPDFWREGLPTIYHPAAVGDLSPVVLSVRFAGDVPPTFINRFRHIGATVDPALQLTDVGVLSNRFDQVRATMRSVAWVTVLVTVSVLLLSAAGIYALMSFTVAQRTREIGIRTALGAPPRRLVLNVCGRAAWQILVGVVVGSVIAAGAFTAIGVGVVRAMPLLLIVAAIMALVALLATLGPARRGVRIPAMDALRAEA
jgi:putative ABC transport system permease protein